jgi:hypothetical protein
MTTLLLLKDYGCYAIVNDDTDNIVGQVYPLNGRYGPYRVSAGIGPVDYYDVGTVQSLDEAIPAFLAHYEKVKRWERLKTNEYQLETLNVSLLVKRDEQGAWLAYRDDLPLLRGSEPARFATCAAAQEAAEAHERDLLPNAPVIDDGLAWVPDLELDWRSVPHLVEERAAWQRGASSYLP